MDKRCSTCHETKDVRHFHKNRSTADGYQNVCKDCKAGYHKQSYKPKVRKLKPIPSHLKCQKCKTTKPIGDFRSRSSSRIPSSPCKECENKAHREKYRKNMEDPSYVKRIRKQKVAYEENRRTRKQNGGGVSHSQWEEMLDMHDGKCLACGTDKNISMDHVKPLSKGGRHEPSNIQPLCLSCNSSKHTKEIDYRQ